MSKTQTRAAPAEQKPEQAQAQAPPSAPQYPTNISVKIHSVRSEGSTLANASVDLNGVFAIRGVKIMQGKNGPFVSMPSYKAGNEYRDVCFPCTKEFREQFQSAVLGAYQQQLGQIAQRQQEQGQPSQEMAGPSMQQM